MRNQKPGTYNIMRKFRIKEISGVHNGAMGEGSNMAIIKRGDLEKRAALTDEVDGHSHALQLDRGNGEKLSGETDFINDHTHPWILDESGNVIIGAAHGHKHTVAAMTKDTSEPKSTGSAEKTLVDKSARKGIEDSNMEPNDLDPKVQEQLDALTKRADRAEKMAELTDAEKAYHKSLSGDEAEAFVSADADTRTETMEKATAEDPIVCSYEGREIRKSEDPTGILTTLAKKSDKDAKAFAELKAKGEKKDLEKRAEELSNLPGDLATKVAMLKSIDSIPDEAVRKSALESLATKNAAQSGDFVEVGAVGSPENATEHEAFLAMAKTLCAAEPSLTPEQAYTKAMQSPEGEAIYNKRMEVN